MYKILYLNYHPHIGGGETSLLTLINNLDTKFFSPAVVVTKEGQLPKRLKILKVPHYIIPLKGYSLQTFFAPGLSISGIYKLLTLARTTKLDIIHTNHLNLAVYAGVVGKLLNIPVIATAHGLWDSYYFFQDAINQIFINKILANTPLVRSNLIRRHIISSTKVLLVPFGIDTDKFIPGDKFIARQKLGIPIKDDIVTIVGRIDPIKDLYTFLKASFLVYQQNRNVTFYIVGSNLGDFSGKNNSSQIGLTSYQSDINHYLSQDTSFSKKIIFGGFIEDMPYVYQATDILVSSSLSESFGLSLAEASACQVPVVATNNGGQNLIVKNNKTGFLVPPQNPQTLAEKILVLLKNKKLRSEFGKNGRAHIQTHYNIQDYVKKVQNIYLNILRLKQTSHT